jgi:glycosyltransferase involved in cell wall biosynthesis
MDVSVLISTYRRSALLAQTLGALCSLEVGGTTWEVLVADNAGDDRVRGVALEFSQRIPLRFFVETTRGKNHALNTLLQEARGELLVFTDDDIIPDAHWLIELVQGARRWPRYAVFGGRIQPRWPDGRQPSFDHPFWRHAYVIADWGDTEGPYRAWKVFGPNMAIRAAVFRDGWSFSPGIGPDGTGTYIPGSETDLTLRLEKAGHGAVYLPRALVFHQIRPEQLEVKWLYRRAFRKGRSDAHKYVRPGTPLVAGIPRPLVNELLRALPRFLISRLSADAYERFDRGRHYWYIRGVWHQCRVASRAVARGRFGRQSLEGD